MSFTTTRRKTADAPKFCPKCGETAFRDPVFCHSYLEKDPASTNTYRTIQRESLKWVCALCTFVIFTPCLDAE